MSKREVMRAAQDMTVSLIATKAGLYDEQADDMASMGTKLVAADLRGKAEAMRKIGGSLAKKWGITCVPGLPSTFPKAKTPEGLEATLRERAIEASDSPLDPLAPAVIKRRQEGEVEA